MSQLETRLQVIGDELDTLAHFSLRSGSGSIGYRSLAHETNQQHEWVEVQLEHVYAIDEIVIVPAVRHDSKTGFCADGFPDELRVWAGTENDRVGTLIATIQTRNNDLQSIAPVIISSHKLQASWVQIEATCMTQQHSDHRYDFKLSEVFVFHGEENVALRQPVTASTIGPDHSDAWELPFLVDGHTPYLMNAAHDQRSLAYVGLGTQPPILSLDLSESKSLSRIHLHAVDQSDTVPQSFLSDFGMPLHLIIEGANQADFSDVQVLLETQRKNSTETGPIMMWRIPEISCRYIRITTPTADPNSQLPSRMKARLSQNIPPGSKNMNSFRIGYAEIELFSDGKNVALGKTVESENIILTYGLLSSLTDGLNLYGKILPTRDWLKQLARRQELEEECPQIEAEISRHYARQKSTLTRMYWLSGILILCVVGGILLERLIHRHQMKQTKKRVAADLHDELGANLHAIGLFGDLAKLEVVEEENSRWKKLNQYLDEVRELTEMTGTSTRYFSQMLDAENFHENLVLEMKHTAERFLADLHHECTFPEDTVLLHLRPRKRVDLFLYYKECLTNIIRHSGATEVQTTLFASGRRLTLNVVDNGIGLNGKIPPSLKRRAQLMRGKIKIKSSAASGTNIALMVRIRRLPS